jgi:photosystem I subunit 10
MVASTGLCLAAGRFGIAPTARNGASAGLKLSDRGAAGSAGVATGDPAGFTAVDVLALGAFGHAVGVGIVLGLRGIGKL